LAVKRFHPQRAYSAAMRGLKKQINLSGRKVPRG